MNSIRQTSPKKRTGREFQPEAAPLELVPHQNDADTDTDTDTDDSQ